MLTPHEEKLDQLCKLVTSLKKDIEFIVQEIPNIKTEIPFKKFKITDIFFDSAAAAETLCVSTRQVGRWAHDKLITFIRVGNRPLFEKVVLIREVKDNHLIKRKRPCKCDR